MYPWKRPEEPAELRARRAELTRDFITKKKATGKTPSCTWPNVRNEGGSPETLQDFLSRSALKHCSYCDSIMGYSSRDTIDHFLPKSLFSFSAYIWKNLYLCCDGCQRKGVNYDRQVLRPDEAGYDFCRYFRSHRDGQITVIATDDTDRDRAKKTIEVLRLNHPDLVADRRNAWTVSLSPRRRPPSGLCGTNASRWFTMQEVSLDDRPFRFHYRQDPEN